MHPAFNEALVTQRVAELQQAFECSDACDPRGCAHPGTRITVAIRRYFDHARAAHQQPLGRPAKRAG